LNVFLEALSAFRSKSKTNIL